MALKKYYNEIHVDQPRSRKRFNMYTDFWNEQFQDEKGKFEKGSLPLRDTHRELYMALLALLINKTIYPGNMRNRIGANSKAWNIEKPLIFKAEPYEIKRMYAQGMKTVVSLQTIKNRLTRLEVANMISRRWIRAEGVFEVLIYPQYLTLKDPETEKIIENIDFLTGLKPGINESKNENFNNNTNEETKINNKIIQIASVDKRDVHSHISSSKTDEHLEMNEQTVQDKASQKVNTGNINHKLPEKQVSTEVARERSKDKQIENLKKIAANKFYEIFIMTFWEHLASIYLLKYYPVKTMHYIEQSIECLMHDTIYFGACNSYKEIEYQYNKMIKALKSTKSLVTSRMKVNPNFSLDYVYPNTFLTASAEKGRMRFKNSMIHIEHFMAIRNEHEKLTERKLQKERDKQQKTRYNHIISNLIAYIFLNSKENTKDLIVQASNYLREINSELVMKFHTDWGNSYLVKQIIDKHKEYDYAIINECFTSAAKLQHDINKLLPELQKKIKARKLTISQKMLIHFDFRGDDMQVIPKNYNKYTLSLINYYLR